MFCSNCGAQVSPTGKFCCSCGKVIDSGMDATLVGEEPDLEGATIAPRSPSARKTASSRTPSRSPHTPSSSNPLTSSDPIGGGRFAPGQIIAERYRVVALLGRGGMGEVYRAEDLTLEQPVALKFLPAGVAADAARLAQFHAELRLARQVSHKNVCRLYDLGDADGRRFLTMEYVDREDLAA